MLPYLGLDFSDIELYPVVGAHCVGLVKDFPKLLRNLEVALRVLFVAPKVRQRIGVDCLLALPLHREGQDVPIADNRQSIRVIGLPSINKQGGGFDVDKRQPKLFRGDCH